VPASEDGYDSSRAIAMYPLVYFTDGGEVTIGRPDIDSYGIFPPDGAELVRLLAAGATPDEAAQWYAAEYGEFPDVSHVLAALDELAFIRGGDDQPEDPGPVPWQRLGRAMFSAPAWIAYCTAVTWAIAIMIRSPALIPVYRDILFTKYYSVIELVLAAGAIPLILLHESFHVLAARRLGLHSKLRISQRFYYLVMETTMDGLVVLPRHKRILPILAGMMVDVVMLAILVIVADLSRGNGTSPSLTTRLCLAFAFATALRVAWQFFFYIRTDLYVLSTTMFGCVDLHTTAARMLVNRIKRLLGLNNGLTDESNWHPVDRRIARWYSWLVAVGYLTSLCTLVFAVGPVTVHMFAGAIARFNAASSAGGIKLLDSVLFVGFNAAQVTLTSWLAIRTRAARRTSRLRHVIT
jgi:hypothetical protein